MLKGLSSLSDTSPWSTRYSYALPKFVPASPGATLLFLLGSEQPVVTNRVGLCIGGARLQKLEVISWIWGSLGEACPGWQVVTKGVLEGWLSATFIELRPQHPEFAQARDSLQRQYLAASDRTEVSPESLHPKGEEYAISNGDLRV
jgi:hypothetical protein